MNRLQMAAQIHLGDHFDYGRLLRFTAPSIAMMVFTSIYGVVDGFFVSNWTGKTPFAAVNIIWPYVMLFAIVGFMFGTGGSALVAKTFGEGKHHRANCYFSLLTYLSIAVGVVLGALGLAFLRPVSSLLGAGGELLEHCVRYGRILLLGTPLAVMQYLFQPFMIAAERPRLNLRVTLAAGLTNMVLDALFIAFFGWGLEGAAAATVVGQAVGAIVPLVYFSRPDNPSILRLGRTLWDGWAVRKSCFNGMSEFMTNLAITFVSMLYNWRLLKMTGEDGVAAYGVIMYVSFVFVAIYIGYSMGVSPVVSFHFGAGNREELRGIRVKSVNLLMFFAVLLTLGGVLLAGPIADIFVSYDQELRQVTRRALMIYSSSFLIAPLNIFASAFFTALNNGAVSAVIATSRLLVFQCLSVLILPLLAGLDGIWLAMTVSELLSLGVSLCFFFRCRSRYGY